MKYKALIAQDLGDLERDVNSHISNGWKPLGGIAISVDYQSMDSDYPDYFTFIQAIVIVDQ